MEYRRVFIAVLAVFLFCLGFKFLFPFFTPFIVGLFIAGLIDPIVNWLEDRRHWRRSVAVGITLTISLMVVFLLGAVILSSVYQETSKLVREIYRDPHFSAGIILRLSRGLSHFQRQLPLELTHSVSQLIGNAVTGIGSFVMGIFRWIEYIPELVGTLILAILTAYFIVRDKKFCSEAVRRYLPSKWNAKFKEAGRNCIRMTLALFRMETLMMITAFLMTGVLLSWAGSNHAWLIGLVVGLLEPLPMIGPGAILLPWAGWLLATGQWPMALLLILINIILMLLRKWLELKLMGGGFGIHPLLTLVGLYVGFKLFGLIGLIIAPLALSTGASLWRAFECGRNFQENNALQTRAFI